jgi:cyanophycinase-like exopeptidase
MFDLLVLPFLKTRRNTMKDTKLIASLLNSLNQNQLALGAAVEELTVWVERRGSADVAGNVRGALATLDENLEFIRQGIAELSVADSLRNP